MARVTAMRGAQSFGFVASTQDAMFTYKAVATKRSDIGRSMSVALGSKLRRRRWSAWARSVSATGEKPRKVLAVVGHLRFATSSMTTRQDAHPHTWLGARPCDLLLAQPGAPPRRVNASRLVMITHNGDFEAFDVGAAFGRSSKVLALGDARAWLGLRLCEFPASTGDSICAAGFVDLFFCATDAKAAARYAVAGYFDEIDDGGANSMANAVEAVAAALTAALEGGETDCAAAVSAAVNLPGWNSVGDRVAEAAVRAFGEQDLRTATRQFLKHAHGAFGLAVCSSLAPGAVVVASVKQPMALGVGDGFVAYASERAALHVGIVGEGLSARRVLDDGDVICVSPNALTPESGNWAGGFLISKASIHSSNPFRDLEEADFDRVIHNHRIMPLIPAPPRHCDVIGEDLAATPRVLAAMRDRFRDRASDNSAAARDFARALASPALARASVDLVVIGVEASLWLAEQWVTNLRQACPNLRVVVASANKVLASLTACANDSTCGAATTGRTVFPSGMTAAEAVRGAVVLAVTHSGQTFPTLNAVVALKKAGAIVFGVCGQLDTALATVLGQQFGKAAPHCRRIFSTGAGIRLAEAASLSTAAAHVLLTELLLVVAEGTRAGPLAPSDLQDLRNLHDASIDGNVVRVCSEETAMGARAAAIGRAWGDHVSEPAVCFVASVIYIVLAVTMGTPILSSTARAIETRFSNVPTEEAWWWYVIRFWDSLLFCFFPVVSAFFLRVVQRRELLARFCRRTVLVLDVPQVHQCVVAFAQKTFALAYGLNGLDVAGANPSDHAVHKLLHRLARGTLAVLGVPDGRLKALVDAECAAYLTASQLKSISNWGVGVELVTVGHHSYRPEMVHDAVILDHAVLLDQPAPASKAGVAAPEARRVAYLQPVGGEARHSTVESHGIVEALYEGRVAALERQLALYVLFHALAQAVSNKMGWVMRFDTWRSQAGTRVATTPSPTSPSAEPVAAGTFNDRCTFEASDLGRGASGLFGGRSTPVHSPNPNARRTLAKASGALLSTVSGSFYGGRSRHGSGDNSSSQGIKAQSVGAKTRDSDDGSRADNESPHAVAQPKARRSISYEDVDVSTYSNIGLDLSGNGLSNSRRGYSHWQQTALKACNLSPTAEAGLSPTAEGVSPTEGAGQQPDPETDVEQPERNGPEDEPPV
mmetsp:Transcript_31034/g.104480  ORF Transcript_31034/g.104480 Transcript_31034/m.104480 type:complete len:1166 (-) Transcript_31034:134-3631(-)